MARALKDFRRDKVSSPGFRAKWERVTVAGIMGSEEARAISFTEGFEVATETFS